MNNSTTTNYKTRKLVVLALFCALSYATMFVFRIKVSFLTFEAKDSIITVAAMIIGPVAGLVISLAVTMLEMITVSDTGFYGFIMNFVAASVFSVTASLIYRRFKRVWAAIVGLLIASISMTAIMLLLNLLITPIYTGATIEVVKGMLLPLLLPFNLTKAILNSAFVMVLYKPILMALKRARALPVLVEPVQQFRGKNLLIFTGGVVVVIACILIMIYVLGGYISLT